ncbi:MAG: hypothetical protein ACYDG4_13260 [Desulfuromonadaceae bacterium]
MGLLEVFSAALDAKVAKHKATKAESDAKIANIQTLKGLSDMIQEKIQGIPATPGTAEFPNAAGDEGGGSIPTISGGTPAVAGQSMGSPLLDMLVPALVRSGNLTPAAQVAEAAAKEANDPKKMILRNLFGGGSSTPPSGPGAPAGAMPEVAGMEGLINDMAGNDSAKAAAAASKATMLEVAGIPIFKGAERVQTGQQRALSQKNYDLKIAEGVKETYKDPTGAEYERYVDPTNKRAPIVGPNTDPAGWRKSTAAQLQPVDVTVPGKGQVRIWVAPGQEGGVSLGPEELRVISEQLPGGGEQQRTIPKTQPFNVTTKQAGGNVAIQGDELSLWVNPQTLSTATQGMTPEQAKAEGFQRVSTQAKQNIDALKAANIVVTEIKTLMAKVFPEKESFASPQRALRPIGAALQTNPDASRLFSLVNGTLAPIVRSLGEKGNLSDQDMKRAQNLFLKGTDSAKVAWDKTNGMLDLLGKIQRSTFSGTETKKGKDLKSMSNEELLKELEK